MPRVDDVAGTRARSLETTSLRSTIVFDGLGQRLATSVTGHAERLWQTPRPRSRPLISIWDLVGRVGVADGPS